MRINFISEVVDYPDPGFGGQLTRVPAIELCQRALVADGKRRTRSKFTAPAARGHGPQLFVGTVEMTEQELAETKRLVEAYGKRFVAVRAVELDQRLDGVSLQLLDPWLRGNGILVEDLPMVTWHQLFGALHAALGRAGQQEVERQLEWITQRDALHGVIRRT